MYELLRALSLYQVVEGTNGFLTWSSIIVNYTFTLHGAIALLLLHITVPFIPFREKILKETKSWSGFVNFPIVHLQSFVSLIYFFYFNVKSIK